MKEDKPLDPQEVKLLEEIDELVLANDQARLATDSLYGVCAELAVTVPSPDPLFREQTAELVSAAWLRQYGAQAGSAYGHYPAWSARTQVRRHSTMPARPRYAWAVAAALLAVVFVVACVPGVRRVVAAPIIEVLRSIRLGPFSTAQEVAIVAPVTPQPPAAPCRVTTAIGGFMCAPGEVGVSVTQFSSLAAAQNHLPFAPAVPTALPPGYSLAVVYATQDPQPEVVQVYHGPAGDVVLAESPVGEMISADRTAQTVRAVVHASTGPVEEVDLAGQRAAWVGNQRLVWEQDGMSYVLGGLDLTKADAVRLASTLTAARTR